MALIQKSVVREVPVAELKVGDRLLMDLMGYKDRVVMQQGKTLNNRDIAWIREKMKEVPPRLATERYQTKRKAIANIRTRDGRALVKPGDPVTEEALAPLLQEGFQRIPAPESGVVWFMREQKWPENVPYRIDQFNPTVRIETLAHVNDEDRGGAPGTGGAGKPGGGR